MSSQRLQIGDRAPDATVLDVAGNPVSVATYWPGGPTVLTFLRHFG